MRDTIRLKTVILALTFFGIGVAALYIAEVSNQVQHQVRTAFLREFATIAIVAGTLQVAFEFMQRREFFASISDAQRSVTESISELHNSVIATIQAMRAEVLSKLTITQQVYDLGLVEARPDANAHDFADLLRSARSLIIVLNDGRTWVSNNAARLRDRFEDGRLETRFFFVHPRSSMLPVLAKKDGTTVDTLSAKIQETIDMLRGMCTQHSRVTVLGHYLYNPQSVFLSDEHALLTPYFHARTRRTVPLLRFVDRGDGSFFRELGEDLEALTLDAEVLFQSSASIDKLEASRAKSG
jgi:hypothetical protein